MLSQKSWSELSGEERNNVFNKISSVVKVKLWNGRIFEFTPFMQCASMPPQYQLKWLPFNDFDKPRREFVFCDEVFRIVEKQGVESDNIEYLNETKFNTKNMKLNLNIENERIWIVIKNLAEDKQEEFEEYDEEYKQQLIKGYKICKGKTYNFKTIEEEEKYFSRDDITAEEEVYFYHFL